MARVIRSRNHKVLDQMVFTEALYEPMGSRYRKQNTEAPSGMGQCVIKAANINNNTFGNRTEHPGKTVFLKGELKPNNDSG